MQIKGDNLNKTKNILKKIAIYIVAIPVVILLLIGIVLYLLTVPFDIIRYHRMPYCKDTGRKYRLFLTSSDSVLFYNRSKKEGLSIEYHFDSEIEYFILDNMILLPGWESSFEEKGGEWYFLLGDGADCENEDGTLPTLMKDILSEELLKVRQEHRDLPAKFLAYSFLTDEKERERLKYCPYFYLGNNKG